MYFANKADIEDQNDVAALFRSTAEGETGHAHGHLPVSHAYTDMYPGLAKQARDEDLDRENDEKTSAVHFLRFEFSKPMAEAIRAGAAVMLGCDHRNYPAHLPIAADTLASLAGDLR